MQVPVNLVSSPLNYTGGKFNLLIEATLADSTNQRRMEMEPVSRHLGDYLLIDSDLLVKILEKGLKYKELYSFFMKMNESTQKPKEWYQEIQEGIEKMVQA